MTTAYSGDGITFPDNSVQATAPRVGMVNRAINGDMRIDQRTAGASVTPADGAYTIDRWQAALSQASKFSVQQSTVAPSGFTNSMLVTSLAATSLGAGDIFGVTQKIEGLNFSDMAWGTASAQTVTISFWTRSSLTGTFGGAFTNSANNRSYPFTYTISVANTWERKTVAVAGDTTGTWLTTNGVGVRVWFGLGMGSTYSGSAGAWAGATYFGATGAVSVVGTSGATFYVTGVQLQKGSTATSFEYVDYGRQLQQCQRYYWEITGTIYGGDWNTGGMLTLSYPVEMRAIPTFTYTAIRTPLVGSGFGYSSIKHLGIYMSANPYVTDVKATAEL